MGGVPLKQVNTVKYLGVTISDNMSFDTHVEIIAKKAVNLLYLLMRSLEKGETENEEDSLPVGM